MIVEGRNRLKVVLDGNELSEYELTFSELDYGSDKTRRMLNTLLIRAARTAGFRPTPGRLLIEAFPTGDGGCVLCFTVRPKKNAVKIYRRRRPTARLFEFGDENQLMECIARAALLTESRAVKSSLYIVGGRYRLAVTGVADDGPLAALLTEYSVFCAKSERLTAATAEHGTFIAGPDAIGAFGAHLSGLIQ